MNRPTNERKTYTLAIGIVVVLAVVLRDLLFTGFLGIVLAVVFSFPVGFLARYMRRGAAVLITLTVVLAVAAGLLYALVEPISEQAARVEEKIPDAIHKGRAWLHRHEARLVPNQAAKPAQPQPQSDGWLNSALDKARLAVAGLVSGLSLLVIVFVLGLFFVHEPDLYRRELRSYFSPNAEPIFDEAWKRMAAGLRHWVGGIVLAMAIMGGFCAIGLRLAGVQNWLVLGLLTFFGTFIPYAGAIASAIPGLLMALSQSGETFLLACGVYLGVHILEGYIVQPFIMKRAVTLPPASLLLWQFGMGIVGGPIGIVVATPFFVCVKIAADYLWVERKLGKKPFPEMPNLPSGRKAERKSA